MSLLEPPPPPLPPEVAFEQGLAALRARELPEKGLVKEYYAELSLLLRRYLEDRFRFPAVEETRTEVMAGIEHVPGITEQERRELFSWLSEGDLVKFARMERMLAEARDAAERASAWVRATAAPRFAAGSLPSEGMEPGAAAAPASPASAPLPAQPAEEGPR